MLGCSTFVSFQAEYAKGKMHKLTDKLERSICLKLDILHRNKVFCRECRRGRVVAFFTFE